MMTSKRVYVLLIVVLVLALASLLGGAYIINGLLVKQSSRLVSLNAKSQALDQEQQSLTKAKAEVAMYEPLEKIADTVVPQDKDQAEAVREIVNIAAASSVTLTSITFPDSTLGTTATTTNGAAPEAAPAQASASTTVPSTVSLSQLQPVVGSPGVYSLQIVIQNDINSAVSFNALDNFLKQLELNRRTAQVSSLTIQPVATAPGMLVFNLTINEYIKPS